MASWENTVRSLGVMRGEVTVSGSYIRVSFLQSSKPWPPDYTVRKMAKISLGKVVSRTCIGGNARSKLTWTTGFLVPPFESAPSCLLSSCHILHRFRKHPLCCSFIMSFHGSQKTIILNVFFFPIFEYPSIPSMYLEQLEQDPAQKNLEAQLWQDLLKPSSQKKSTT